MVSNLITLDLDARHRPACRGRARFEDRRSLIMPYLARIALYPVKSLDGVDGADGGCLPSGPLENDRRWAIFDKDGQLINGKHTPAVQRIRAKYSSDIRTVQLSIIHGSVPESRFD